MTHTAPEKLRSTRKIYLRIFAISALGMAACMGVFRFFAFSENVGADTMLPRVMEAREALPKIVAEEHDLVMFFGSSMTDAGFAARLFDRRLAEQGVEVKSFNFGFAGLNPYFQDYLARRVRDAFDQRDRQLEMALIELNPFQATARRFENFRPAIDSFVPLLASSGELWEITRQDPTRGIRMLTTYYFRDAVSAEMSTDHFAMFLRPPQPRSGLPVDRKATRRRNEIKKILDGRFREAYPDFVKEPWSYAWQGSSATLEDRSPSTLELFEEYYATLRTPRRMEDDRLRRIQCCDIEELHFEEELIRAFLGIVRTFQQFSKRVEIVLLPRNTEWIRYTPATVERLDAVIDRIEKSTGLTVKNYQEIDRITPGMFNDTTHLARGWGDVVFTTFLAEELAPLLTETPTR